MLRKLQWLDPLGGTRVLKEVTMDKNIIKETMLSLEGAALQSAREKYFDYVADARLDRSEPIESDEQAQARNRQSSFRSP